MAATFQKPQPLKASLKMALYGNAGSGKTFTGLLIAEGLARACGKRIAVLDTEQGTAFYGQPVAEREAHPAAFDFDVLHTRSITDTLAALRSLDLARHGVVVIDSITHLWDSCKNAFTGKMTKHGAIPLYAWTAIKRPYRELMHWLLTAPVHVLICGRQAVDYAEDETTGELKSTGFKMRAEGETAYEPDVLLRLEPHRTGRKQRAMPTAFVEKDRTGILAGRLIEWPGYDNVARPLLGLLGTTQAGMPTDDEVGLQDAEALAREEAERTRRSSELAAQHTERFRQAESAAELQRLGQGLTATEKALLTPRDLERVRRAYRLRQAQLQPADAPPGTPASAAS